MCNTLRDITYSKRHRSIEIDLYLVTNAAEANKKGNKIIEDFQETFSIINSVFYVNNYNYFIEQNKNEDIKYILDARSEPVSNSKKSLLGSVRSDVFNVSAYEIAKLYKKFNNTILEKNVRKLIKSKINTEIADSLKKDPGLFWFKNNGITIVCDASNSQVIQGRHQVELLNPYIVNGGQTTKTIFNEFAKIDENSDEDVKPFVEAELLVRVYQTKDQEIINSIVTGTNNQNKITATDLKSLHPNVPKLKDYFSNHNIDLITKRDSEKKKEDTWITLDSLLQIYWSLYKGEPHIAKISKSRLVSDKFDLIFDDTTEAKNLLIACKTYNYINPLLKKGEVDDSIRKYGDYAVLYYMTLQNPKLLEEYNEQKLHEAFKESLIGISKILEGKRKNNVDFSPYNFFKSGASTSSIKEYISSD